MTTLAFLFPGQGSQHEGMGLDLMESSVRAREMIQQANAILGWSFEEMVTPEKKDSLNSTLYTQPAIYVVSCVIAALLQESGIQPACTAGHSAGELAALTAAGAWDFETGLRVIARRAQLMHEKAAPGGMAAVMGLAPEVVQSVCHDWTDGIVQAANFNSLTQTVISGEAEAITKITPVLKEHGARRVLPLKVSGAFHSPLMKEAQAEFAMFMKDVSIRTLSVPWVSNNTGMPVSEAETVREHLVRQFCEPVRWVNGMAFIQQECEAAVEVGPGEVLKGLVKACCGEFLCSSTNSMDGIMKAIDQLKNQFVCVR